jgi:3-hydroxyacyl-[acyl-carrier-protein] dehydratase
MGEPRTGLPLPHAYPFLLLDRVVAVRAGHSARAIKQLTCGDPVLDAAGVLPPVLLAEAMAQTAGIAAIGPAGGMTGALARIERFRSRGTIGAGDRLDIRVRVLKVFGTIVKARGVVRVGGRVGAAAEVFLQLSGPRGQGQGTSE